ncbi:hypothetical protein REDROCK_73 [Mycobacterium phage RedRock]|uniref:Uncharacterized protein n=1 Tax=Mycobacterium phage RedRock TaxID=711470 RepID=D3JZD5_9CAUD|nr:hypothetical protein REDROCK_73 [Mycobacterium phage RedRock]ADB93766.1 hypothetical protein REDROCK_73 [Mycobacterium phage RedRock]
MALSRITAVLPEVVSTPPETIAAEPNWLYAQKCEVWWRGSEHLDPVTVLLTYRSPLVKCTSKMYRPISKLILAANRFDVLCSGTHPNPDWWGETGQFMVARLTHADAFPEGPIEEIRAELAKATNTALKEVLQNA